jgi:hydroxymethylpyrimidine pyrophosphatase-like HAD family hydrolase
MPGGAESVTMERYDLLYRLYDEFDAETLRELQGFVDLFPPVDSRTALDYWDDARAALAERKADVRASVARGDVYAAVLARAAREEAFTALDLHSKHGRRFDALVLDVDETLRSAGRTDNEIPRDTLYLLRAFHEAGVPLVVCTGQTLENVKGFAIQGLGNELVHSGNVSIVYEAGAGVFTPGHGSDTKRLLYEELDESVRGVFDDVRTRVLRDAPADLRRGVHLQGNEFNVTLKPNFDVGSEAAAEVVDRGLVYLLDLLGECTAAHVDSDDGDGVDGGAAARAYYAAADPEVADVLAARDAEPDLAVGAVPEALAARFERVDVAYYHADAAEVSSLELNKVVGVEAALSVLGAPEAFVLVMGDSKSDLRVMEWAAERDRGVAAAPVHASGDVLDHVRATDELVFERGDAASVLRTAYVVNLLASLDE